MKKAKFSSLTVPNLGDMKRNLILSTVIAICTIGHEAYAQSGMTVSGVLETGVHYSTNQNAAGDGKVSIADGAINPSRIAVTGNEDLGGGLKALFKLDAGLQMKDGSSVNGSINDYTDPASTQRLFGREAFVGLSGGFGKLTFGRQYTSAYVASWGFDPIYGGGLVVFAPYFGYLGLRQDNMVRYEKSFGDFGIQGHHVFGEKAGSNSTGSGYGIGLSYNGSGLGLTAAYQESNNDVAAAAVTKRKTAVLGGSYVMGHVKASLGYIHNTFDGSPQKNDVVVASLKYADSGPWVFTAVAYNDRQKSSDGRHTMLVGIADYNLSKRTALFVEADYHKYTGGLLPFGAGGPDNQAGVTVGVRHLF